VVSKKQKNCNIQTYNILFALKEMMHNIDSKTLRWSFIKSIEPPRVVHARVTDIITQDNLFAQLTVRFHTKQVYKIYLKMLLFKFIAYYSISL